MATSVFICVHLRFPFFVSNRISRLTAGLVVALTSLLAPLPASALIMVGRGNAPVTDAGWPEGALAVANLKSRVGYWEGPPFGGGEWQFLHRGDTAAFGKALTNFAAIRAPALDLVIHDGPQENIFLKDEKDPKADTRVDWTFTVWVPANWHRLYNNPKSVFSADQPQFHQPVDPPRLDVYVGGGGQVDWAKVKVPGNVRVRDERVSAAGIESVGGALVRVEAYAMATGKPVPGARVVVAKLIDTQKPQAGYQTVAEAAGDDAGRMEVAKIPPGTYRLSVEATGYAPRVLCYQPFDEKTFRQFTTELAALASVSGSVTDDDGKPLTNVAVNVFRALAIDGRGYLVPDNPSAVTDATGHFELTQLPAGYVQLSAAAAGYHFSDVLTIRDAPSTGISLRLYRAGGMKVTVTDKSGKVISSLDGKPLMIHVEPKEDNKTGSWGGGATVKDDGTVEFTNVPPGQYRITSRPNPAHSSREYAEQIVTVTPGPPINVKVVYE
jgi:hypothetical protein